MLLFDKVTRAPFLFGFGRARFWFLARFPLFTPHHHFDWERGALCYARVSFTTHVRPPQYHTRAAPVRAPAARAGHVRARVARWVGCTDDWRAASCLRGQHLVVAIGSVPWLSRNEDHEMRLFVWRHWEQMPG